MKLVRLKVTDMVRARRFGKYISVDVNNARRIIEQQGWAMYANDAERAKVDGCQEEHRIRHVVAYEPLQAEENGV